MSERRECIGALSAGDVHKFPDLNMIAVNDADLRDEAVMTDLPTAESDLRCALLLARTSLQTLADAARSEPKRVLALVDEAIAQAVADADAVMADLLLDFRIRLKAAPQLRSLD